MVVNIIDHMSELGFSENESKTYLTLLQESPVTAYEAAKNGGLPTAKIYQVMAKLVEKGVVLELIENGKKRYVPLEPEDFIDRQKNRMDTNLAFLKKEMAKAQVKNNVSYIWNMSDWDNFEQRVQLMINQAEGTILISLWEEEFDIFYPLLKTKEKQGVSISVVLFGSQSKNLKNIFLHPIGNQLQSEKGGRNFSLVCDSKVALAATILDKNGVEGAWSGNRGFVTVTEDYIKHDIYILKIVERFDEQLINRFGNNYHYLRDVFSDEEEDRNGSN